MVKFFLVPIENSWFLINYNDGNLQATGYERSKVNKTGIKLRFFEKYESIYLGEK